MRDDIARPTADGNLRPAPAWAGQRAFLSRKADDMWFTIWQATNEFTMPSICLMFSSKVHICSFAAIHFIWRCWDQKAEGEPPAKTWDFMGSSRIMVLVLIVTRRPGHVSRGALMKLQILGLDFYATFSFQLYSSIWSFSYAYQPDHLARSSEHAQRCDIVGTEESKPHSDEASWG